MVHVHELHAQLSDDTALADLLGSIPLPHSVRGLLRKPFFGRRWDSERRCDHWLASDGKLVVCVKVSGAPASIIARMRTRFDDLRIATPGLIPSRETILALLDMIAREDSWFEPSGGAGAERRTPVGIANAHRARS